MDATTYDPMARKRPLPLLSSGTHAQWFQLAQHHFKKEGILYVLETTRDEYRLAKGMIGLQMSNKSKTPESTSDGESTASSLTPTIVKEAERADLLAKWERDDASATYTMLICLGDFDQELVEDLKSANEVWKKLKAKYYNKRIGTKAGLIERLYTYRMNEDTGVEEAWLELARIRRQLKEIDPVTAKSFDEEGLFQRLLRALPSKYTAIRDAIDGMDLRSVEHRMGVLKDKEDRLNEETALIAKKQGRGRRSGPSTSPKSKPAAKAKPEQSEGLRAARYPCRICDDTHYVKHCPYLEMVRAMAVEHKKKTGKTLPPKAYSAEDDRSDTDSESDRNDTEEALHAAEDDDDHLVEKGYACKAVCKIPASEWVADTGASKHMTDQLQLFRGRLKTIPRRTVIVGGGKLHSDQMGTVVMRVPGGSSVMLAKTLYVPNLGVNLLSERRLAQAGFDGTFDEQGLYLVDPESRERVISATLKGGVYIVSHIADKLVDRAFQAKEWKTSHRAFVTIDDSESMNLTSENTDEDQSPSKRKPTDKYILWHRRFAHLGAAKIEALFKTTTLGEKLKAPKDCICRVCEITKKRNHTPKKLSEWDTELLGLVSIDIAGQFPLSIDGHKYFLQIVENSTRKVWSIPIETKDEAIDVLEEWRRTEELSTGKKLKAIRSDNAPELKYIIDKWASSIGIVPQYTVTYMSSQNGVAERSIQTTENGVRAMIKEAELPIELWHKAAEADAYLRNRTACGPYRTRDDRKERITPEEAYTGVVPNINHIRVWGSVCYTYVHPKSLPAGTRQDKFMDRGRECVFVGYTETARQLQVYAPDLGYVIRSSVVTVDESRKGGDLDLKIRKNGMNTQGTRNELVDRKPRGRPRKEKSLIPVPVKRSVGRPRKEEQLVKSGGLPMTPPLKRSVGRPRKIIPDTPLSSEVNTQPASEEHQVDNVSTLEEHQNDIKQSDNQDHAASPQNEPTFKKDQTQASEPSTSMLFVHPTPVQPVGRKRQRDEDDNLDEPERQRQKIQALIARFISHTSYAEAPSNGVILTEQALSAVLENEPRGRIIIPDTYRQAISDPEHSAQWKRAINAEIQALEGNDTWTEQALPKGANKVSCKWVFSVKYGSNGAIERYKARLVARGFSQRHGVDYDETFSPTVRMDTLRLFLAIVAREDLECHHVDVNNAFTEATLVEDIYLTPPEGVNVAVGKVLKINKSLYGLKQAGRNWNDLCVKVLKEAGFEQSKAEPCMLTHRTKRVTVLLYVDDIPVAAKTKKGINWFKDLMRKSFKIKDLREIKKILGVRITRNRKARTLKMDQEQYINDVLTRAGFVEARHKSRDTATPMFNYDNLRPTQDSDEKADIKMYQKAIGELLYGALQTRPDIAQSVRALSQYMSNPGAHHMRALRTVYRYLRGTVERGITFSPTDDPMRMFADSDWAQHKDGRKSVSGSVCMFHGGPISWTSKKQTSVATSSTEAEYMSLKYAAQQSQWLRNVLVDMRYLDKALGKDKPMEIMEDNQGAIALVKNPHLHERSKHIDISYHYTRDLQAKGMITTVYIPTEQMAADGLTKPLPRIPFERFLRMLRMID